MFFDGKWCNIQTPVGGFRTVLEDDTSLCKAPAGPGRLGPAVSGWWRSAVLALGGKWPKCTTAWFTLEARLWPLALGQIEGVVVRNRAFFCVVGPDLWNMLPEDFRRSPSVERFWQGLKRFLFNPALERGEEGRGFVVLQMYFVILYFLNVVNRLGRPLGRKAGYT